MDTVFQHRMIWLAVLMLTLTAGCGKDSQTDAGKVNRVDAGTDETLITSQALPPRPDHEGPLFDDVSADETGVRFVNELVTDHPMRRLYMSGFVCGGVSIGDVDGDGRADLYFTNGPGENRLFRQVGDWRWEDVTAVAGVAAAGVWSAGATMADIDNDGDLDIYVAVYNQPNLLYVNQGNGVFREEAKVHGLAFVDASMMSAFCDYDRDGDLDMFLLTNRLYRAGGRPRRPPIEVVNGKPRVQEAFRKFYRIKQIGATKYKMGVTGRADHLFRNQGDGRFERVTEQAGISPDPDFGLSATWFDYDGDGWPDLYVANDWQDPDRLYRNNGDGTFTDVIVEAFGTTSWFSMGVDFGDLNGDGKFDLVVGDMNPTTHVSQKMTMGAMSSFRWFLETAEPRQYMRSMVHINSGTSRFFEAGQLCGLARSDWTWAVKLADFDEDGREDVFYANGMIRNANHSDYTIRQGDLIGRIEWDLYEYTPERREQNLAFRNVGELKFEDVSEAWGLAKTSMSFSAAYGDLDNDGDLDLIVSNMTEPVSLYRNNTNSGHRITVRLIGKSSNAYGIGTKVEIETGSRRQVRQLFPASGYLSTNRPIIHFGTGEDETIRRITVSWPSGWTQQFYGLASDRAYTVTEPGGEPPAIAPGHAAPPTLYRRSKILAGVKHVEKPFDDYARQPLLPNKMSQLGPGMAWGDADGDGDDDLYLGGAAGKPGQLWLRSDGGQFEAAAVKAFAVSAASEDMAALWFDVDADGDQDLYVVSGGVECEPGDEVLRDRLYINVGSGRFVVAPPEALPDLRDSGGVVVAADFDRDGDLDLFIGGRQIPGRYPLIPRSRLLRNNGGRFEDVTETVAAGLVKTGLVTGALWSDANGDGWLDLLVTHDWGPVKVFINEQGRLVDRTEAAGLASRTGWWNSVAGRDLDADGDIDYVVTNFGMNTKYQVSPGHPALMYVHDFEDKGRLRLVENKFENNELVPIRGKSCSLDAMPHLRAKFSSYRQFAMATLDDIYSPEALEKALKYEATALESGVLINDGQARFSFHPLPWPAQISPGFGLVLTEVNGDGRPDLYMVQNFFSPQPETGRMNGGLSVLLTGLGGARFEVVTPARSGLVVPGDAKGLTETDLNGDGWPDFVIATNNDELIVYEHRGMADGAVIRIDLLGRRGNRQAIGARVTVRAGRGYPEQTAEVYAGGGYLSQSPAVLTFGAPRSAGSLECDIVWPDGKRSTLKVDVDTTSGHARLQIIYPH